MSFLRNIVLQLNRRSRQFSDSEQRSKTRAMESSTNNGGERTNMEKKKNHQKYNGERRQPSTATKKKKEITKSATPRI